jgi:hypothetical protein
MSEFRSVAERHAEQATSLPSFPIKLIEVRRTVEQALSLFGRNLIFSEYTAHDITHIDDMLSTLDWVVPIKTQENLTSAEWLFITLAIYFHDMGLLVTEEEFQNRDKSGFDRFVKKDLFGTPGGGEYEAKINLLEPEIRERMLYQEFVRWNHGARIRSWIEGNSTTELGYAKAQITEIGRLLAPLDSDFKRDLGIICESHNLDDLEDTKKYKLSQPYGNSDAETANLQYCAVVLRTIDLLQITNRRAPSALYRVINPSDPISQVEWLKQNAVKRVKPKPGLNKDGVVDIKAPTDTIEVYARFENEGAFFGLTSYLRYANEQLETSFSIIRKSHGKTLTVYEFPWRSVDDSHIEVDGFLKQPFGFVIDQDKILELLTGHTLYNDSNVVVRELVQNAIDAVRLQYVSDPQGSKKGSVKVAWDPKIMQLSVQDNGTGMTQQIIEDHLLKVGSSRYQDPKFVEANPDFSPISRFGIGVLSAFMVADSVEIVTVSESEDEARQISLRSVHGKYLIRLLDKKSDERVKSIGPHGTIFRLTFRSTAKPIDVVETIHRWVMFPRCRVTVQIGDSDPTAVGHEGPKEAIEAFLKSSPIVSWMGEVKTRVVETEKSGLTVAYALKYDPHYREWDFLLTPDVRYRDRLTLRPPVGTCVEGIAVEFSTPGFVDVGILAVANATGRAAPRTNVARSAIEATREREAAADSIYRLLTDGVAQESERLTSQEGYSLTWALEQLPFIVGPLLGGERSRALYPDAHKAALSDLPLFIIEDGDSRKPMSLADLKKVGSFSTVESQLTRSVEQFIREAKTEVTAAELMRVSQGTAAPLPTAHILSNRYIPAAIRSLLSENFEVSQLTGHVSDRRLDLTWRVSQGSWLHKEVVRKSLYETTDSEVFSLARIMSESGRRNWNDVVVPRAGVDAEGLDDYACAVADRVVYILPGTALSKLFDSPVSSSVDLLRTLTYLEALSSMTERVGLSAFGVDRFYRQIEANIVSKYMPPREPLVAAIEELGPRNKVFDPMAWNQREASEGG